MGAAALLGGSGCAVVDGLGDYSSTDKATIDGSVAIHPGDGGSGAPDTSTGAGEAGGDDAGPAEAGGDDAGDGSTCTSTDTVDNCGACGVSCDLTNSTGANCTATGCEYTGCAPGWLDCETDAPNSAGCESSTTSTASCGACGNVCDTEHSLGASCVASADGGAPTCAYTGCAEGWADCDTSGFDTDGCETSLATASNCGACGKACDKKNSQGASCADGATCSYTGCNSGYADCNTTAPDLDGCETMVASATCNACGQSCDTAHSAGAACNTSASTPTCTYTSCTSGYKNCNTTPPDTNGCETQVTTVQNCGNCGVACDTSHSTGASCSTSGTATCKYTGCASGWKNCTTTAPDTNGCETSLNSTSSCGGCPMTNACSTLTGQPSCDGTKCSYACNSGHTDCNAGTAPNTDGCECASPGCCSGNCQTTHTNGVGQNFFDCNNQGSHNQSQAQEACAAYTGNASACSPSSTCCGAQIVVCLGQTASSVCGTLNGKCYCWQYSGPQSGRVESPGSCSASCGSSSDPSWN